MRQFSGGLISPNQITLDSMRAIANNGKAVMTYDAALGGGMAFLEGELEKKDPRVREPLTSVTWMRDMVWKTGGGWVENTSAFFVDYGISGPNQYGLQGGQTNAIPIMQADLLKDKWPTFNWMNILKITFVDQKKAMQIGRSLDEILDKGIRLNWNKTLDLITYNGWGGQPGLFNAGTNTTGVGAVYQMSAATGASGLTTWVSKTPDEILYDVNMAQVATWANSQYDLSGMADYCLVPPTNYALLQRPVSLAGNQSILAYLLENNIGKAQGRDLQIMPSNWWGLGAGAASTNRMVMYANDPDKIHGDITVPITRAMTAPSVSEGAYLSLYAGQVGVVKFLYYEPVSQLRPCSEMGIEKSCELLGNPNVKPWAISSQALEVLNN